MKLRIASDIHLEFDSTFRFPVTPEDKETTLVLAGDIGCVYDNELINYRTFLEDCASKFKLVILVLGNHEYYHSTLLDTKKVVRSILPDNVLLLDGEWIKHPYENAIVYGGTMWTKVPVYEPMAKFVWGRMSDSRLIRYEDGTESLKRLDLEMVDWLHQKDWQALTKLKPDTDAGTKTIIITHHGLLASSVHPRYAGDYMNILFCTSDRETNELVDSMEADLLIHGHTHTDWDYIMPNGKTRVICNPKGYPGEYGSTFNENLTIEI